MIPEKKQMSPEKKQTVFDFILLIIVALIIAAGIYFVPGSVDDFYQAGQLPPNLQPWPGVEELQ